MIFIFSEDQFSKEVEDVSKTQLIKLVKSIMNSEVSVLYAFRMPNHYNNKGLPVGSSLTTVWSVGSRKKTDATMEMFVYMKKHKLFEDLPQFFNDPKEFKRRVLKMLNSKTRVIKAK